LSCWQKHVS